MSDIIDHGFTLDTADSAPAEAEVTPEQGTLDEGTPEQGAPEVEQVTQAPPSDEPRHTVKVDGNEYEVPLSELVAGYQRNEDYTRKTQALADQRRSLSDAEA